MITLLIVAGISGLIGGIAAILGLWIMQEIRERR
jgi:hypothetical protein